MKTARRCVWWCILSLSTILRDKTNTWPHTSLFHNVLWVNARTCTFICSSFAHVRFAFVFACAWPSNVILQGKLLGSRRLAKATKLMLKTAKDPKRLLGSQRLKEARQILFDKAALTNKEEVELEKKLMGSTRLNLVRKVLVKGASEMKNSAAVAKSTLTKEAAKAAAPAAVARMVGAAPVAMAVVKGMTRGGDVSFCGQKASAQQVSVSLIECEVSEINRWIRDDEKIRSIDVIYIYINIGICVDIDVAG